jgi:hypothetical protein
MSGTTEEIDREDLLNRRVLRCYIKSNGGISSAAFKDRKKPDPELSVDLARLATPERTLSYCPGRGMGVVQVSASVPLDMGLTVEHCPVPDNDAHCLVKGMTEKRQCQVLAEKATIVIPPS